MQNLNEGNIKFSENILIACKGGKRMSQQKAEILLAFVILSFIITTNCEGPTIPQKPTVKIITISRNYENRYYRRQFCKIPDDIPSQATTISTTSIESTFTSASGPTSTTTTVPNEPTEEIS